MSDVVIKFKDGTERQFKHEGRAGGSYTKTVTYKGNYVIVEDEWYKQTAFPSDIIAEVVVTPERY